MLQRYNEQHLYNKL